MSSNPPENPILNRYNAFVATTPYITRASCHLIVGLYLFSWFIDLTWALSNVPFYTIMHLEVYRLLFSPFCSMSFLSVIFVIMSFVSVGAQLERSMGSTGFLTLMGTLSLTTNVAFVFICYVLYFLGSTDAIFSSCGSFWIVFMSTMVVECMNSGMETRRLMFLPVQIPIKFYPLALYAMFMLFVGFQMDNLLALGVGYAYVFGQLKRIEPSNARLVDWERGFLSFLVNKPGFITSSGALGNTAWLPLNNPAGHPSSTGGPGFGGALSSLFGGQQQQAQQPPPAGSGSGATGDVFGRSRDGGAGPASSTSKGPASNFVGTGFTLGGSSPSGGVYRGIPTQDPDVQRNARLQALQGRGLVSGPAIPSSASIDDGVMTLQSMGYDSTKARNALEQSGGNVEVAIELLHST